MPVYLLHFERPLYHAQHYLGSARSLRKRLERHASGNGARLPAAFFALGIGFVLARQWSGGRAEERALKRRKNGRSLCPICNPK